MPQSLQLHIKSSIFDRERQLTINEDSIEFDKSDLKSALPIKFLKEEVDAFRYGIRWINGYQFTIGQVFCIDIRNLNGEIIKVRLKSVYGVRKKQLAEKYSKVVNALFDHFFDDIARNYLHKFALTKEFSISGVKFTNDGIFLKEKPELIKWDDIETRTYHSYYSICSKSRPALYNIVEYLEEWNGAVLYSVLMQLLKEKGFVQ